MESDKHINNNENHATYSQKSSKNGNIGKNTECSGALPELLSGTRTNIVRRLSVPTGGANSSSVHINTPELKNLLAFAKPKLFKSEKKVNKPSSALTAIPAPVNTPIPSSTVPTADQNSLQEAMLSTTEIFNMLNVCDNLIDKDSVIETRKSFMSKSIESYEQATMLLGYFSQLQDFKMELAQLNHKLTNHRKKILETYIDIMSQETIKSLTMPSNKNKLYQKGINKFYKVKNYILYHYKQKLYTELESEHKQINNIREIVYTITRLDKHYDIYNELITDLQKKNKTFDEIMRKHLTEFIYI